MTQHAATDDAHPAPRRVGVVVVAAGSGRRLGADVPKAAVRLAGRSVLAHALDRVLGVPGLAAVVIVVPEAMTGTEHWDLALGEAPPDCTVRLVAGAAERTGSVAAGLAALDPSCEVVLVHDAARCLTPTAVFQRVVAAVVGGADGVVPAMPVVDTVKVVDHQGYVTATPERSSLRAVQTPQGFAREVLLRAHAGGLDASDDAALVERAGHRVLVVEGDPLAFKVTTPEDLERAERLVTAARAT